VFVNVSDPVGNGIVQSHARPGGNITGGTDFGTALAVKQLDLLQELLPKKPSRIAVLMSDNPVHPLQLKLIQDLVALPSARPSNGTR
jgi:putative tryptophan/tyrosine transport system substrate-binding protein